MPSGYAGDGAELHAGDGAELHAVHDFRVEWRKSTANLPAEIRLRITLQALLGPLP